CRRPARLRPCATPTSWRLGKKPSPHVNNDPADVADPYPQFSNTSRGLQMTAAVTCRTCGGEPRAGARFCDACGTPITSTQAPAEYKQVTVLFADVVRSMDIAAAEGPERLREIMAELLDRSAAIV